MGDAIQQFDEIAPMNQNSAHTEEKDPLQAEYKHGKALLERDETGPAAVALHNALVGFQEKNDENGIANASNQLALTCIRCHDYDNALLHLQRAEKICDKLGDPMSLVALSKQFVVVYTAMKQYKQAIERSLELLDYYKGNNDPKGSVETMERMAEVYQQSREIDKAVNAYETIASIHRNFKHHNIAAEYQKKADELKNNGC